MKPMKRILMLMFLLTAAIGVANAQICLGCDTTLPVSCQACHFDVYANSIQTPYGGACITCSMQDGLVKPLPRPKQRLTPAGQYLADLHNGAILNFLRATPVKQPFHSRGELAAMKPCLRQLVARAK